MTETEKLDDWRLIRKLLDGKLTKAEKVSFWERYDNESDFRKETDDYITDDLNVEMNGLFLETIDETEKKTRFKLLYKTFLRYAAVVLVLIGIAIIIDLFVSKNKSLKHIEAENKQLKDSLKEFTAVLNTSDTTKKIHHWADTIAKNRESDNHFYHNRNKTNEPRELAFTGKMPKYEEHIGTRRGGIVLELPDSSEIYHDTIPFRWDYDRDSFTGTDSLTVLLWNIHNVQKPYKYSTAIKNGELIVKSTDFENGFYYYYKMKIPRKRAMYGKVKIYHN